ncbi:hypothetical protein KNU62_gp26 [Gordonia phage Bakery]|uniref:Uncharacterized protein n=1 Tax=Gordonia phage Bakery TaxID=2591205 RepID=A0A514DGR6_9CAUD|nr:hypothetical protein KNU62_gp26 [Gordonia phage Bakery]QDH92811.1 hypothetical protein SEA_BAKERY_26 [Gordonia phage Bakery]
MAEVTIEAQQHVAGLAPGDVVTVEHTEKIAKLILHGRVTVIEGRPFREGEARSEGAVAVVAPDASADLAAAQADARETLDRLDAELNAQEQAAAAEGTADAAERAPASGRRKKPTGDAS